MHDAEGNQLQTNDNWQCQMSPSTKISSRKDKKNVLATEGRRVTNGINPQRFVWITTVYQNLRFWFLGSHVAPTSLEFIYSAAFAVECTPTNALLFDVFLMNRGKVFLQVAIARVPRGRCSITS